MARAAGWSKDGKALQLALCFIDEALTCLLLLSPAERDDYGALVGALQRCFRQCNQPGAACSAPSMMVFRETPPGPCKWDNADPCLCVPPCLVDSGRSPTVQSGEWGSTPQEADDTAESARVVGWTYVGDFCHVPVTPWRRLLAWPLCVRPGEEHAGLSRGSHS